MKKETNLDELKEIATALLYIDPEPVEQFPVFVIHPFFETRTMPYRDKNGKVHFYDIFEDKEKYAITLSEYAEIIKNGDINTIFAKILTKYHFCFLKFARKSMSKEDFEKYLAYSWIAAENPNQDKNVSISTFIRWFSVADRKNLMEKDELKYYDSLPDEVTIYRGVAVGRAEAKGLSWTCNHKTAEWFASRFNQGNKKGYIIKGKIRKEDIFAYLNGRGEDEILCNSSKVYDKEVEQL